MEGVKDLHEPCARYGITQVVIRVRCFITKYTTPFRAKKKIRCIFELH